MTLINNPIKLPYSLDSFWVFSTSFYADPAVGAACLALQDTHGLDVLMVLSACYAAATDAPPLRDAAVAKLVETSAPWRTRVIAPLRQLRRDMKTLPNPLGITASVDVREEVKRVELVAERALIEALDGHLRGPSTAPPADVKARARCNLTTYARVAGRPIAPAATAEIETLIAALAL